MMEEIMKKLFFDEFKTMDSSIQNVLYKGLKFCFVLCLIATFSLSIYLTVHNPYSFYFGINIFSSTLFFSVFFVICSIFVDTMKVHKND